MAYFFAALSSRKNLEVCKRFALAGFPETGNGVWAYVDIQAGDFVTFLYGGRAHNLYKVKEKEALRNAKDLPPPWEPIQSKRGYVYFPYRLRLQLIREFNESLARPEFLYIAENLLRRGGIRKSHFQADQTTLSNASCMGEVSSQRVEALHLPQYETFIPQFVKGRENVSPPEVNQLREEIINSILRQYLSKSRILENFLIEMGLKEMVQIELEVLGERALERGYVDLLIKEARPSGIVRQIVIEVKPGIASRNDVRQLQGYMEEIGDECVAGALIAGRIAQNITLLSNQKIHFWQYAFKGIYLENPHTFEELLSKIYIWKIH